MTQFTIWTTELVNQAIEKLRIGVQTDIGCFHDKNIELKASNILFNLTSEELKEFEKCSENIVYFVEKYCHFLTDLGRIVVDLRRYQKEILNELGEEEWKEKLGEMGPKNRNYILMAARQVGKCFLFNTQIVIKNIKTDEEFKISIGELYNIINKELKQTKKQKFISKIKSQLYKFYQNLS